MELSLRGMHPHEQYVKGEKVVQGADRSHTQHESPDRAYVPAARGRQLRSIHVVAGNRDLRDVIEKIVEQDLSGQHRQERQDERCCRHAEDIAEVRAGAHQQVLHDVGESLAALDDAGVQGSQIALAQDDVCRIAATSTALATEMPTSAACSDGASLIPSPRKPTTARRAFRASTIRCFCAGLTRAKTLTRSATMPNAS